MKTKFKSPAKVSKAQVEIWKAKDKMYEEVKHLPLKQALKKMLEKSQRN